MHCLASRYVSSPSLMWCWFGGSLGWFGVAGFLGVDEGVVLVADGKPAM